MTLQSSLAQLSYPSELSFFLNWPRALNCQVCATSLLAMKPEYNHCNLDGQDNTSPKGCTRCQVGETHASNALQIALLGHFYGELVSVTLVSRNIYPFASSQKTWREASSAEPSKYFTSALITLDIATTPPSYAVLLVHHCSAMYRSLIEYLYLNPSRIEEDARKLA